jgi:subtilisin family serine protease
VKHARELWKVDIISLSLGFESSVTELREEIKKCLNEGIMVFAAASNDGGNAPRTYPATQDRVFGIHSATSLGNKASFNPDPKPDENNLSFLGVSIKSFWPLNISSKNKTGFASMSGTSFATPVAVSVTAFIVGYVWKNIAEAQWVIDPKSPEGMKAIFSLMKSRRDDYDWISPQAYFKRYSEEKIRADVKDQLCR